METRTLQGLLRELTLRENAGMRAMLPRSCRGITDAAAGSALVFAGIKTTLAKPLTCSSAWLHVPRVSSSACSVDKALSASSVGTAPPTCPVAKLPSSWPVASGSNAPGRGTSCTSPASLASASQRPRLVASVHTTPRARNRLARSSEGQTSPIPPSERNVMDRAGTSGMPGAAGPAP